MKKTTVFLSFLCATMTLFNCTGKASAQEFTFRGLPWGSSVEDIIAKEGQPDFNQDGYLSYRDVEVSGYKARLTFYCWPSIHRLYMARYLIISSTDNVSAVYADLFNKLRLLYGSPTREEKTISAHEYYWVVSRTKITLDMSMSTSSGTLIGIRYESPEINGYENL